MTSDQKPPRLKPLAESEMSEAQLKAVREFTSGLRGQFNPWGPNAALLRSPEMGDLAQQLGAYVRFRSALPRHLNEMAIIMTARVWTAQYEWYIHKQNGLDAGLNPAIVAAIAGNRRPASMKADEQAIWDFTKELLEVRRYAGRRRAG